MNLRKQLSSYIALNNYVEAIRSSQLPTGYTELEYIESTGTQYIDTGVVNWNNTLEYEIKLSIEPQSGIKTYFGCYDEWSTSKNNVPSISTWTNYKVASNFRAGYSSSSGTNIGISDGQTGTISFKGNTISWSEGSSTSFDRGYDFTVSSSIFLFALHTNIGATEFATTKIYRTKFWLNGELIRDFRPMLDYNNVACMFDMVTGKCFYNQGTDTFITGPEVYKSSIVLTDAITNGLTDLQLKGSEVKNKPETFLDSVVAKGGTEQNGTPTPDTPMDIVSNNGVLKVRNKSGLPLGYTLLDYIESSGTQYIDTGVVLGQDYTNTNIKLEYDALINNGANWQVCGTMGSDGIYIGVSSSDIIYYGTGFNDTSTGVTNPFVKCKYINDAKNGVIKVTNLSTNTDIVNLTHTPVTKTTVLPMILFGFSTNATTISPHKMSGKMYNAKIYNDNELIRHFIPAKRLSDSVIGMYDTVTDTFFTNQGTGTFTAGSSIKDLEIYTDGTVETIESHGKNLCDSNAFQSGYVNPTDGTINTNPQWLHTDYLYIGDAETYTYSLYTSVSGNAGRECAFYDKDKKFISGDASFVVTRQVGEASKTFTVPEGAKYIRISVANLSESQKDTNVQLEQGSTATEYEPYYNGGTATAEMLLKVGDYQDVQEILSGDVTRKIGVKVLDGTEDWAKGQSFYYNTLTGVLQADHSCYCTHFQGIMNNSPVVADSNTCRVGYHIGSDIDWNRLYIYADMSLYATAQDFANYLAHQYAAGTPVIVVYPLNASTTETVSPQKLFKNPVTVTEASINDLEVTTTEAEHTVPTPDYPLDIVCNNGVLKVGPNNGVIVEGTPETVTITGKNLFNESHIKSVASNDISVVIPVKQNKTYTWSYNKTEYDFRFDPEFIWGVDLNGNRVENGVTLVYANGTYTTASYVTVTVVSPNVVALQTIFRNNIIPSTKENVLASSMQLEEGIRPTKYEEYYQASFAPEDLLKLGDYQDVQSVLDGIVARNIGIKVLDGTEGWTRYGTGKFAMPLIGSKKQDRQEVPFATHFVGTSHNNVPVKDGYVSVFNGSIAPTSGALGINYQATPEVKQFKQWLADQYAAGTPVIVVYPLADTVEETVESRDVFITSGTNTIERNSEYVSSDGMTVNYKKLR